MMRDDQIVRVAVAVCLVPIYYIHVAENGGGPVSILGWEVKAFTAIALFELTLAFPELLDRMPYGKNRTE